MSLGLAGREQQESDVPQRLEATVQLALMGNVPAWTAAGIWPGRTAGNGCPRMITS